MLRPSVVFGKDDDTLNKGKSLDVSNFEAVVFQPDEEFYKTSFDERLKILEIKINLAKEYFKNNDLKGIFVAPEYLFKDLSQTGEKRYFTHEQKKKYKEKLQELSKDTEMIIAAGTICWSKKSKKDNEIYYRNMMYIAKKGELQKYKKAHPHQAYDYDYTGEKFIDEKKDKRAKFFRKGNPDSSIKELGKEIGDLTIGTEICFDTVNAKLTNEVETKNKKIHIQLIVADDVRQFNWVKQNDVLLIHVERQKSNKSFIGTIKKSKFSSYYSDNPFIIRVTEDKVAIKDNKDLHSYKFKK